MAALKHLLGGISFGRNDCPAATQTFHAYTLELDVQVRVPQIAHTLEQLAAADAFHQRVLSVDNEGVFQEQRQTGQRFVARAL